MTREEALMWLRDITYSAFDRTTAKERQAVQMAIEALLSVPNCQKCAIKELWEETEKEDLVSVVRCKDCRYFKKIVERSDSGLCYRDLVASAWKENGYCSRGERR